MGAAAKPLQPTRSRSRSSAHPTGLLFALGVAVAAGGCSSDSIVKASGADATAGQGSEGGGGGGAAGGVTDAGIAEPGDGCASDVDTDFDQVSDCLDGCVDDFLKTSAGVCGCGTPDVDIDGDGTLDCLETCPEDIGKTAPGVCGCGEPDTDADADGTVDCQDRCPFDATRTAPGSCGCGAPDDLALCLRHRYSFDGGGSTATDSVGTSHGAIFNTALSGDGTLVLAGVMTDQYVELPAGIISSLGPSGTFEVWLTWTGAGAPWQRIFDFGSSGQAPGQQGTGATYLFVTPSNTINTHLRAAYTVAGPPAERVVNGPTALPFPTAVQLALVVDGPAQTLTLYQGGVLLGSAPTLDTRLEDLHDVNNWIGRSQFVLDEEFQGTLNEFRIYGTARSAAQISADFAAGPDALPEE